MLEKPRKGKLFVMGKEVSRLNNREISNLYKQIGLVLEEDLLIDNINVADNILLPLILRNENRKEIALALKELIPWLNLEDLIKTNQLTGGWLGLILKFKLNKPLIVRTGFDKLSFHIKEKRSMFSIFIIYIFTQICISFSDVYFVTSETDRNFLTKYLIGSNKIKVRPNWVYVNKEHSIDSRKENILMVGRLEDQKNYAYVFESLKDSEFIIDIYGSGSKKKELENLAFKNNLNVNFFGNVENKDLLNIYSKYKYLLISSKFEGNSKVILEGMGSGCIVFASNIPNNSEIIANQVNGYLFDFNDDLKSTISNVQNQSEIHDSISKNALKTVIDKYSIDKIIEEEYKTYLSVT